MINESHESGWFWAQERLFDFTSMEIMREAEVACVDAPSPDDFYEGVIDRLQKESDR